MADLATFARRIRGRARRLQVEVDKAVVETAIVVNQAVVITTPVDTGRARANWLAAIDTPITEETDFEDPSGKGDGPKRDTIADNNAVIKGRKVGQSIYLSNNLGYIQALNDGSSSQAPANFVQLAIKEGVAFLRRRKVVK